jgi:hypothetical protein
LVYSPVTAGWEDEGGPRRNPARLLLTRKHEVTMSVYRSKIIASLCLLLAVCTVLLRPESAEAQGNQQRQFVFGPVYVASGQFWNFAYSNTGPLPTPPATVVFRNALSGAVLLSVPFTSAAPGESRNFSFFGTGEYTLALLTFDRPGMGQGIPSPFPGTVQLVVSGKAYTVLGPAPR